MTPLDWKDRIVGNVKLLVEVARNARIFPEVELRAVPARKPGEHTSKLDNAQANANAANSSARDDTGKS